VVGTDNVHRLRVGERDVGTRLDAFISAGIAELSRTRAAWHILHGHVAVDDPGGKLKPGFKLRADTTVTVTVVPPPVPDARPQDIPLSIAYEDDALIVVDKPAGLVMHPAAGHPDGTLINALLHHDPALADVGESLRPGLVHRLDKDTSGLLVVARTAVAHAHLARQFAERSVQRRYRAICLGKLRDDSLRIETLYGRHPRHRKRFSGRVQQGKNAITHVSVLARSALCSLVDCRLQTGRTHQIRVHLAERGHPIAGDELYGGVRNHPRTGRTVAEIATLKRLPRQALHAWLLDFEHPVTGARMRFVQPWPDDLADVAEGLFGDDAAVFEDRPSAPRSGRK